MQKPTGRPLFVVVALIDALDVGRMFSRSEWPAHVTLASNFLVEAPIVEIAGTVGQVCGERGPIAVRFAGDAMFGRNRDVRVQLVESAEIVELHARLADLLESSAGFTAAEPDHWRDGYRAHMTHVSGVTVQEGGTRRLNGIAIAELTGDAATVTAAWKLGQAKHQRPPRPAA